MTPDDVLSQYPGPVTLRSPTSVTVAVPGLVAVLCVFLLFSNEPHAKAIGIVIGGFAVLYAIVNYFRPSTIELTAWGFTTKDYGGAVTKCRWRDVSDFGVSGGRSPQVQYFDKNYDGALFGNVRLLGVPPPFSASQMAALMNAWRERSLPDSLR